MGDHRASIRITAKFHGKTYDSNDWWINYSPSGDCGCDERVCQFFKKMWEEGHAAYEKSLADYWSEKDKEQTEKNEKAELERLKAKYEVQK